MPGDFLGDRGEFWQFITNAEHTAARTDQGYDGELHVWYDTTANQIRVSWYSIPLAKWTELSGHLTLAPTQTQTGASITLDDSDHVVLCDCTSNAITVNLPAADPAGRIYSIKKIDASGNAVTVDGNGSETIDGTTTKVISVQYDAIRIVSDGSSWWII